VSRLLGSRVDTKAHSAGRVCSDQTEDRQRRCTPTGYIAVWVQKVEALIRGITATDGSLSSALSKDGRPLAQRTVDYEQNLIGETLLPTKSSILLVIFWLF